MVFELGLDPCSSLIESISFGALSLYIRLMSSSNLGLVYGQLVYG